VMLAALSAGGHLRVGMEDTLTYAPGEPVRDNTQLVARAAGLARIAQRPPMPVRESRALLGVRDRRPAGAAQPGPGTGTGSGPGSASGPGLAMGAGSASDPGLPSGASSAPGSGRAH